MSNALIAVLSKSFNARAADTRAVLKKYDAKLSRIIPGGSYYAVKDVEEKKEDAFLADFKKLKGVESAYKKPSAAVPVGMHTEVAREKTIIFREHNDHEGETWNFYLRHTPALEKALTDIIAAAEMDSYEILVKDLDLETVRALPNAPGGYMATHNIVGDIDVAKLKGVNLVKDDVFYKGGIEEFAAKKSAPAPKAKKKSGPKA